MTVEMWNSRKSERRVMDWPELDEVGPDIDL